MAKSVRVRAWLSVMSELKFANLSPGERCRALANECRSKASSFRNDKLRMQMFQLAADYERKARVADASKESTRMRHDADVSLAPQTSETFEEQSRETLIGKSSARV